MGSTWVRATTCRALAVVLVTVVGAGWAGAAGAGPVTDPAAWTVYHQDAAGNGVAPVVTSVDTSTRAWTSPALDGQIYGEPLVAGGRVYVATEDDVVYALSSTTGSVVWSTRVAEPVPATSLPCGDIQPTVGITGTPVIDLARGELYAVADELSGGRPTHVLVGLSTASGATEMTEDVDPSGADPAALLQRSGLALDGGEVVLTFGGNYGDCASYRGRVVAVPEAGGTPTIFTVDAATGESQGAIWMGGAAPGVDAAGNIWVGVGNGSVTSSSHPYDDSDSVLELSPSLDLEQYFAPADWASNNARDLDMSMEPVLLADGHVLIAGKSRIAYVLDGSHLAGIGGQQAQFPLPCSDDVDGGSADVDGTVYLPCLSGVIAVSVTAAGTIRTLWSSGTGGGPPIVAAGLVWTIGQNGVLYGLDPSDGATRQEASVGTPANHFPTPAVGDGLLLAPSSDRVVAFATRSGSETTTLPTAGTTTPPTTGRPTGPVAAPVAAGSGGTPAVGVAGIVAGVVVVLGLGGLWWRRRRRHRPGGERS